MTDQALLSAGYDLAARWTGAATDPRSLSTYRGSSSLYGADLLAQPPGECCSPGTRAARSVKQQARSRMADWVADWRARNPDKVAAAVAKQRTKRAAQRAEWALTGDSAEAMMLRGIGRPADKSTTSVDFPRTSRGLLEE